PGRGERVACSDAVDQAGRVAGLIHTAESLAEVGLEVVEVALEEARVGRHATDLAHRVGVVRDPSVGTELRRRAFFAAPVLDLDARGGDPSHGPPRIPPLPQPRHPPPPPPLAPPPVPPPTPL